MANSEDISCIPESILSLVRNVCEIAGNRNLIDDARVELASAGVIEAVKRRRNADIFNWLMNAVSFQGISDAIAYGFIESHERIRLQDITKALNARPTCPKLRSYHAFYGCGYRKWKDICAEPSHKPDCPLPRHELRNGRLNRTAYSLALFFRDVCLGDFVGWVDYQLRPSTLQGMLPADVFAGPVIGPMGHIEGIGPKVLSMSMATLLLGADAERSDWLEAGARMIAIDTLVHNWLHRTGILHQLKAGHEYGVACYRDRGCSQIIEQASGLIDARQFNSNYPLDFPRFIQHAIWRFCAQDELNTCNGNRIKDTARCQQRVCELYPDCARRRLHLH